MTLADLSDGNVALARKKAAEAGVELTAMQADALDGGTLPKGPFDHVLCMGPLYHLLKEEERKTAIANCLSRLRPGGVFFAAFISMYGDLLYRLGHMADWPEGIAEVDGNEGQQALLRLPRARRGLRRRVVHKGVFRAGRQRRAAL